jgi:hypothetical protein
MPTVTKNTDRRSTPQSPRCPAKPSPSTLTERLIAHEPSNPAGNVRQLPAILPSLDKSAMSESLTVGKVQIKFRAFFGRFGLEWEFHKRFRRY